MLDKTLYTKDSIESLEPREHVRLRPGMYIGSTSDTTQLVVEIFSNALDEHNLGHGNLITVELQGSDRNKAPIIVVKDCGQGFPIDSWRDDGETVLQASFDVINTSGKYSDDGVYGGTSLGLNGVGAKATNFLASKFEVVSTQNGKSESLVFKNGILDSRKVKQTGLSTGTSISFVPDPQFFKSTWPDIDKLRKMFDDICGLCPTLTIQLITTNDDSSDKVETFSHPKGIVDLVDTIVDKDIPIVSSPMLIQETRGKHQFSCGLTYTSKSSSKIIAYVNYGLTDQGPHIVALKSCITRVMNKWAREQGLLKEKEKNLDGDSLQEGLVLVFNLISPGISYDAQTKSRIVSKDFVPFLNDVFSKHLELWLDNNPTDGKTIIDKALLARRAAEAAKKAREAVKAQKVKQKKNKILHPDKLKDAEYLGQDSTLLLVEGLSAGASMSVARDSSKYGILMLRGKLINAFTNSDVKLLKNEEIQLLIQALGIDLQNYHSSQLRYGRIAICTDSDSDGHNIGLLIAVALQHFCPQFIEENRLCWLRSPLYILKTERGEQYFFSDSELDKEREKGKLEGELQRNKGLGSLSPQQARDSMFGEKQHIDILKPDEGAIKLLEKLMGSNVTARKNFILKNIDFAEVRE